MVWYGIVGFNVPIDTLQVISETIRTAVKQQEWRKSIFHEGIQRIQYTDKLEKHSIEEHNSRQPLDRITLTLTANPILDL